MVAPSESSKEKFVCLSSCSFSLFNPHSSHSFGKALETYSKGIKSPLVRTQTKSSHPDYLSMFEYSLIQSDFSFDKYFSALFFGIDARTQERTMERIQTIHTLLFPNSKKDFSFMCAEVMWVVFTELHNMRTRMPFSYDSSIENQCFFLPHNTLPRFSEYMREEWGRIQVNLQQHYGNSRATIHFSSIDIPQILIWYLSQMYPNSSSYYQISSNHPNRKGFEQNVADLKKFDALLKIIK